MIKFGTWKFKLNMKHLFFIIAIFISFFYAADAKAGVIVRPAMNTGLVGYWNFMIALDTIFALAILKTLTPLAPSSDRARFCIYE